MRCLPFILAILLPVFSAVGAAPSPVSYVPKVVREYPHDVSSYTQGLFFHDGQLYESTGLYGKSTFRRVELKTGKALDRIDFNRKFFAEGSVVLGENLYILTWTNKMLFVYDAKTLKYKQSWSYPREGWGLTTDGQSLIASDGSSKLYFLSPELKLQRTVDVKVNGKSIRNLNELEWIDGKIWANVYLTDVILIINPHSGGVEGVVNCKGLLDPSLRTQQTDVLNGIAHDPSTGRIYLTGKNWPKLFEIKLMPRK